MSDKEEVKKPESRVNWKIATIILALVATIVIALLVYSKLNAPTSPNSPKPSPTPTEEEISKKKVEDERIEKIKLFEDFLSKKYQGWRLKGFEETQATPFVDLHIYKDKEEKVIKVLVKEFTNVAGETYTVISEVTQIDLALNKLEDVKKSAIESHQEEMASYAYEQDYDPGADYDR